jgi:hypothetical protein
MKLKITLPYDSWKVCRLDTTVFNRQSNYQRIRVIGDVAELVITKGWDWCKAHVGEDKLQDWWGQVQTIVEAQFALNKFYQPELVMHVNQGTLELSSDGNHRMIALGVKALREATMRIPIDVWLEC